MMFAKGFDVTKSALPASRPITASGWLCKTVAYCRINTATNLLCADMQKAADSIVKLRWYNRKSVVNATNPIIGIRGLRDPVLYRPESPFVHRSHLRVIRLSKAFGGDPENWLQMAHDLAQARKRESANRVRTVTDVRRQQQLRLL
jgi:hypothetical protein